MPWTTSVYILQVDNTSPTVGFLLVKIHRTSMKKMWIDLSSNFEACLTKGIDWMCSCTFMKYIAHVSPIFPKKTNCYSWYGVNYIIKKIRLKLDSTFWRIVRGQLRLVMRSDGYCGLCTEVCMDLKEGQQSCKICVPFITHSTDNIVLKYIDTEILHFYNNRVLLHISINNHIILI